MLASHSFSEHFFFFLQLEGELSKENKLVQGGKKAPSLIYYGTSKSVVHTIFLQVNETYN